ncbi:MAG: class I SAM-dependent methyltransferase [Caldilineaceae bacterium]
MANKDAWKDASIVEEYAQQFTLQPPEETILKRLKASLPTMKMLDLGVGGGRTTVHFAKLVKEYIGVDYSEEMIAACRKRFLDYPTSVSFAVGDVRCMEQFKDNTFDFILFSFNGIDYISHAERLAALREIHRVGKTGGYFCFSTHHLKNNFPMFELKQQLSLRPRRTAKNVAKWFMLRFVYNKYTNIQKLKHVQYAVFNDGVHNHKLQTYHIKPLEQIKQLKECFNEIEVYSLASGNALTGEVALNRINDDWLYYLCKLK